MDNSQEEKPEFCKDWEVDAEHYKATHKTGITFTLVDRADDGDIKIKFSAPTEWIAQSKANESTKEVENTLKELKKEFKFLMKDISLPDSSSKVISNVLDKYRQKTL